MRGTFLSYAAVGFVAVAAGASLGGCTYPRTELVIGLMTDLSARDMIDTVTLTAEREDVPLFTQTWVISGILSEPEELPGSFGVFSSDGSEPRVTLTATGLTGNGATPVVQRVSVTSLVHQQTLFLRMALVGGCSTLKCPDGDSCVEGVCKPAVVDAKTFPVYAKNMEKSLQCDSGPKYRDTSTKVLMPVTGDCAADEDCVEGTCYKRAGASTGGIDLGVGDGGTASSCDPIKQTGCAGGQKCYVAATGAFLCKATGTKAIGELCTSGSNDDCAAGLHCSAEGTPPDTAHAVCRQYCGADSDCTEAPAASAGEAEPTNVPRCFEGLTASTVRLCSLSCDPVGAGAGCATGRTCGFFTDTSSNEYTDCFASKGVADGQSCTLITDCATGETCAQSGSSSMPHCRKTCRPDQAATDCSGGLQCPALTGVANPIFSACCPSTGC
jgi:hypothetical protein